MLRPKKHNVGTALPRVKQKRKRQPRFRADWMADLKARDLLLSFRGVPVLDRKAEELSKCLN
jgi:hypothetical protein